MTIEAPPGMTWLSELPDWLSDVDWSSWLPGTLVGVLGVAGGVLIAHGGRRHDERMAKERFEHEQRSARAQWLRERRSDTYVQLLDMAERVGHWAALVRPLLQPAPPVPPLPDLPEQARVEAYVRAYGSTQVLDRMQEWRAAVGAVRRSDFLISLDEAARGDGDESGIDVFAEWRRLPDLRKAEQDARKALVDQVAADLGSR
jgi:hypothetical protein